MSAKRCFMCEQQFTPPANRPWLCCCATCIEKSRNLPPDPEPDIDDTDLFVGASYKPGHDSDLAF